jgi:hypothetical protein
MPPCPVIVRIDTLIRSLVDIATMVSTAARGAAIAFGLGALLAVLVMRLEPPAGFGGAFPGWWIVALALFAPAIILAIWSFNVGKIVEASKTWPHEIAQATRSGVDSTTEVLGAVKSAVAERRGLGRLVKGVWGMRSVAGSLREIAGDAVPAMAAFSPFSLLATAAAVLGGLAAMGIALLLGAARFIA